MVKQSDIFGNRYSIISVLGTGGMGTVYLVEDCKLKGKQWAIKEIKLTEGNNKTFVDEAKMLINLDHPYLPKIVDYYYLADSGYSYLVMDYIKGKTLKEIFEENGNQLALVKIMKYALQICNLFNYLHNKQESPVIYRDLKPSNIMIDEYDNVKLIDFGIARNYDKAKKADTVQMGTVGFAAPEQFENKQTDHRTDIYSLGSLIYFLLSGGKYYSIIQESIDSLRNDLPQSLVASINKMLRYDPDERYQNIQAITKIFEEINQNIIGATEKLIISEEIVSKDYELPSRKGESNQGYKHQEVQGIYSNIPSKQIMIANLSKKAGSTFVTINLAKYISEYMVNTNVVELPFEPYIFDYLGINQRSGNKEVDNFYSFPHEIINNNKLERGKEFNTDLVSWIIPDPRKPIIEREAWTYNHMLKLLYSCRKANITFIDAGANIDHQSIEMIFDEMDLVLIIVDPMPSEIIANYSKLEYLLQKKESGLPVEFVVNKLTNNVPINDLTDVIGAEPITYIPNIDLALIHKAVYSCNIPYDYKEVSSLLKKAFNSIQDRILPSELIMNKNVFGKGKNKVNLYLRR